MKLIVDIDENYYKGICKIVERFGKGSVVLSTPEKIMFNGTPLSEELEKIKEEILEYHSIKCYGTCETYCPYSDCIEPKDVIEDLQIIDKHISELKGE